MKTLKYTILAFLLGINFVSCTPDNIGIEDETLEVLETLEMKAKKRFVRDKNLNNTDK